MTNSTLPLPDRAEPSRPTFGALSYVANLAIFACERTTPFAAKDAQWLSDNLRELLDAWDAIQRGALEDGEHRCAGCNSLLPNICVDCTKVVKLLADRDDAIYNAARKWE